MEIIRVIYHREPEGWWAESDAVPGWSATAATLDELRTLVEDGVRFALDREDVIIEHGYEPAFAAVVFDFVKKQPRVAGGADARGRGQRPEARSPLLVAV